MDDSDKAVEEFLNKTGVKFQKTKPNTTFSFDIKSGALITDVKRKSDQVEESDYEKLLKRKALFCEGSLLITKTAEISAFFSYDFKETVADLYMKGLSPIKIAAGSALMVLKEGTIKSKFDLTSDWTMGMMAKREIESCYRYLKVLATNKNNFSLPTQNENDSRPVYFTILINPDFDLQDLQEHFQFSDNCINKENLSVDESDLTSELSDRMLQRRETKFKEMAEMAENTAKNNTRKI